MTRYQLILFALSFLISPSIFSQVYSYIENQNKDGMHLISSDQNKIELEFSIYEFSISEKALNGEVLNEINYGFNFIPGEEGTPLLPFISKNILIPNNADFELIIKSVEKDLIEGVDVYPSPKIPFDTEETEIDQKGNQYLVNANYPAEYLQYQQTEIRGMNYIQIALYPFQINPVSQELTVIKNIQFDIKLDGGNQTYGEDRFRSAFWDPILSDFTMNYQDMPDYQYSKQSKSTTETGCEYLIIVPDNEVFISWADTIRRFRNEQGILTKIMTIEEVGGNDYNSINTFFNDVYNSWDPVPSAVLLMADYGEDENGITSISYTHPYEGFYITDNFYADVTNNALPDFVFARMTARNNEELQTMVKKFINYESNPPMDANFYDKPITALGWQTERWFQICTETVGGYMTNVLGKTPTRINALYEGNPSVDPWSTAYNTDNVLNYFGPSGLGYIPYSPAELGGWTGGTAQNIVDAINSGSFILQHRDHGNYSGWGEPDFNISNISQLNNIDKLTHVFTINCLTGQFNVGNDCFAEKFHRYQNGGALSLTAPTQVSYSFVNDALVWGSYDNMWPDFMPDYGGNAIPERDFRPAFGLASGKYFLSTTNWASNSMKIITYRLFHHHGDAFGVIYTEVPQENEVVHEDAITTEITSLNIAAANGTLIGLSVDGELLATGIVENGSIDIEFEQQQPGTDIKIVATKQNYLRYESTILVVPAEGPYVLRTEYTLNDDNANGEVDYNEIVSLDIKVKNVGMDDASNVVLSLMLDDPNITIANGTYNLGTLAAGEEIEILDAFVFSTDVNIPDQHLLEFVFDASDDQESWQSDLNLISYAPHLIYSLLSFEEIDGDGNGYLDPGESAIASFTLLNSGHRNFPAGESSMYEMSDNISITSSTQNFDAIAPNNSHIINFEISASASTPYQSIESVTNQISAALFDFEHELFFSVGLIVEDWESETTTEFEWQLYGDEDWFITDGYTAEGEFALRSGNISDNESSFLSIDYEVAADHQISFEVQVSTHENHDYLHFYIDDELIQSWSGLLLFQEFSYPVSAGSRTFKWEYTKDEEGQNGVDAAWLDFIVFPPGTTLTGMDDDIKSKTGVFSVFPNPAQNELLILNPEQKIFESTVYNTFGQTILSKQNTNKLDISRLSKGVYLIKVEDISTGEFEIIEFVKM
jgi:hypothetical protein